MNQHEYAGCDPDELDESLRQLKADGRKVLDFTRNDLGYWIFKIMAVRE